MVNKFKQNKIKIMKNLYGKVALDKLPNSFWFKKFKGCNWIHYAFIKYENSKFYIYFVNKNGQIFDRLPYKDVNSIKRLLRKNKFISSNNEKCDILPDYPLEMQLMFGKKSAPYSIGNSWIPQERFKISDNRWKEYQEYAKTTWDSWSSYSKMTYGNSFEDLMTKSEREFGTIYINGERIYSTDLELTIKSEYGESTIWLASSMNYISNIWRFLEAVIKSSKRVFYYCDEEGTDTFLYVKKLPNEYIKFIQISTVKGGSFKVLQDIILPMEYFIEKFYNAITEGIKNYDKSSSKQYISKYDASYKDFIELIKGSAIVNTYLFGSG